MSSETSTKADRRRKTADKAPPVEDDRITGFQPWHLFLVGTLLASAAAAVAVRGTSPANVIFVCLTVLAAGWTAYLLYRASRPLVEGEAIDAPEMVGGRTRAALEREKTLVLRSIKELEFDRAMGKVSEADYQEMTSRLRARAVRLIRQLDKGRAAYRELIEKELNARRSTAGRPGGSRQTTTAGVVLLAFALSFAAAGVASAQMSGMGGTGMPDAKAMSGIPRPAAESPAGTITVRVVRGQLSNPIAGHPVDFVMSGRTQTATTDENGRASISGAAPGSLVRALTTVDGERLESQDFEMPPDVGVVLLLAASDKTAAKQSASQAVPGAVVLSGQSRIVLQLDDDTLQVFYLLEIVNGGPSPVKLASPLVFDMPEGAQNTTIMEGSTPLATANGQRVTVEGPFPPGSTPLQVASTMPPSDKASIRFTLPAPITEVLVIAEKAGEMVLSSAQVAGIREVTDQGKRLLVGNGPGLKAGDTIAIDLSGLPQHPAWPRNLALSLAVGILALGAWGAARTGGAGGEPAARRQLEARREKLLAAVARLDADLGAGLIDEAAHASNREELMGDLERVYGELDTSGGARYDQGLGV